ncbi:MAG: 3-hydroxybutyryl-CoA dehydrogenase [Firmicutes bacterium]|nr:3-hydroxybutyryl-CoA dehydrogenase [Bacillota bacterium]
MTVKNIFVYGTGTMGRGIAQAAAQAGFEVYFCNEIFPEEVELSIAMIKKGLDKRVQMGKMNEEEANEVIGRIIPAIDIEDSKNADFIIETIIEDVKIKQEAFKKLEKYSKSHVVLASNTTSCSITEIASVLENPSRVIGFHFFNPAHIMKLLEIMPGLYTEDNIIEQARDVALKLGKDPVVTKREAPAGLTSRVLAGLLNEAVWVLHEGIASVEDIDKAIVLGCNHKIGPLALIDLIGVDIHLAKTKMLYNKTGDSRYRPCYLLEQMVTAGYLGKKSGKGFYDYTQEKIVSLKFII